MASRGQCKHEAAKTEGERMARLLALISNPRPLGELIMGPTPYCPQCAYEAGREWWQRVKAEAERKSAEPPMYAGPLPEPP